MVPPLLNSLGFINPGLTLVTRLGKAFVRCFFKITFVHPIHPWSYKSQDALELLHTFLNFDSRSPCSALVVFCWGCETIWLYVPYISTNLLKYLAILLVSVMKKSDRMKRIEENRFFKETLIHACRKNHLDPFGATYGDVKSTLSF